MTDEMEQLPADLASLLRSAQQPPALPPRALDRMEHRLGLAVVVAASVVAPSIAGAFFAKLVLFFSRKLPLALVSLAVGAGMGATGHALVSQTPSQTQTHVAEARTAPPATGAPSAPAEVATPPAPTATLAASALPAASASAAPVEPRPAGADALRSDLAEERALLEMGRTALARGNHDAALEATRRHERAFPRGRLSEERELIAIQALSGLGRRDEARTRAARFLQSYPRSMFAPAVRAAAAPDP